MRTHLRPTETASAGPSEEEIRKLAYQLWIDAGQPEGRDLEHWFAARAKLARTGALTPGLHQTRASVGSLHGSRAGQRILVDATTKGLPVPTPAGAPD